MEQNSPSSNVEKAKILEAEIRESFGKVVYSQKIQDMCAIHLRNTQKNIKFWQILLSAISSGGFLGVGLDVFSKLPIPEVWKTIGNSAIMLFSGLISLVLLCLNSYVKENNLCEKINCHKRASTQLWAVRERYIFLLTSIKMGITPLYEIMNERTKLFKETEDIYKIAPYTDQRAYKQAQKALQKDEELTFSQAEIDNFLPEQLRFDAPVHQNNFCSSGERPTK